MSKPPFDPIFGGWVILMTIVLLVGMNSVFLFVGCAVWHVPEICTFRGERIANIGLELITAVAVLIAARKKD